MLTCIPRSKQSTADSEKSNPNAAPHSKPAVKNLTSQIKDMALKASGAYKNCNSCTSQPTLSQNASGNGAADLAAPDKFRWSYRRTGSFSSNSTSGRKELEARLKGISSGEVTPTSISASASGRRADPVVLVEEKEPMEWVAQVEPGVLITFVSLPRGGNDLKRIRFSREMFNKNQAQKWWAENYDKVMELYNVMKLNRQAFPLPTQPRSIKDKEQSLNIEASERGGETPVQPLPLHDKERSAPVIYLEQQHSTTHSYDGAKTETSSMTTTSLSRDEEEFSISNASDLESEWVEQDEGGVYITIRALPSGRRELRRVRFRMRLLTLNRKPHFVGSNLLPYQRDCSFGQQTDGSGWRCLSDPSILFDPFEIKLSRELLVPVRGKFLHGPVLLLGSLMAFGPGIGPSV